MRALLSFVGFVILALAVIGAAVAIGQARLWRMRRQQGKPK